MNTFNPLLQKLDNKRCNGRNNNPNQMMFFIFVDIFLLQRAASAARCDVQESKGTGPLKKVSLFLEIPGIKTRKEVKHYFGRARMASFISRSTTILLLAMVRYIFPFSVGSHSPFFR